MRFLCRHISLRPSRVIVLFYVPRQCSQPASVASAGQSVVVLQSQSAVLRLMLTLPVSRPPSRRPVYLLSFSHSRPSYVCQSAGFRRTSRRTSASQSVVLSRCRSSSVSRSISVRPNCQLPSLSMAETSENTPTPLAPAEGQDLQHRLKRVQVCIPRAACGGVRCLFFWEARSSVSAAFGTWTTLYHPLVG